jgi:protein arginine kinase activator
MNIFCDECKKNIATVFLTKMSGNEVSRVQLCDACAQKMEETTEAANLLAFLPQILSGLQTIDEQAVEEVLGGQLVNCDECGTSFNDFQKMGFLGCARCYESFGEPLQRNIFEFQGSSEHVGKMPGKVSDGARLRKKMMELERSLEHQISAEEYEAAAAVRDEIRELRSMMNAEAKDSEKE